MSFPRIEKCLGMEIKDTVMEIRDGYSIMGFDYDVGRSSADCLFNLAQSIKEKQASAAKRAQEMSEGSMITRLGSMYDKLNEQAKRHAEKLKESGAPMPELNMDTLLNAATSTMGNMAKNMDLNLDLEKVAEYETKIKETTEQFKNMTGGLFGFFQ